jgi:hypothetical protein
MDSLEELLKHRPLPSAQKTLKPKRKGNPFYGLAMDLERNLDLPLPMCFKLLKKYTPKELSALSTWWKDYPFKKQNNIGLLMWKLKQLYPNK